MVPSKTDSEHAPNSCGVKQGNRMSETLVLEKAGSFSYEERDESRPCIANEVLIRVLATGICGSDVHYWKHGRIGDAIVTNPIVLGHESAGVVEACGPLVKHLMPGDRIALEPGVSCTTCEDCRAGRYNICEEMRFAATPPYDGTLATYYRLPEECCFTLPPHVSFEEGALVEPLAVAVHCCKLAGIKPGGSLAVFGAGPIGLLVGAVARQFGASKVILVDILQSRLDFAEDYLPVKLYNISEGFDRQVLLDKLDVRIGADAVIEATGNEKCAGLGPSVIPFPVSAICSKEATFIGSFRYGPGDYQLAIELLSSGRVAVKPLISKRYDFGEAEQAFKDVAGCKGIKNIIYGPGVQRPSSNELHD